MIKKIEETISSMMLCSEAKQLSELTALCVRMHGIKESVQRLREMSPLWNQELDYDGVMCTKHGNDCRMC